MTQIKKNEQLSNWADMVRECCGSGKSVTAWCSENGIKVKTYYYRQSKVREAMMENFYKNEIVSIGSTSQFSTTDFLKPIIKIRKKDIEIELSEEVSDKNLEKILRALQC